MRAAKKFTPRDPPAALSLPPASPSPPPPPPPPTQPPANRDPRLKDPRLNRDPRLNKSDPRVNRDPRIKKQVVFEDQVKPVASVKPVEDVMRPEQAAPKTTSGAAKTTVAQVPKPKMDLASLMDSFTQAAAKVAAEKKSPPKPAMLPTVLKPTVPATAVKSDKNVDKGSSSKTSKDNKSKEKNQSSSKSTKSPAKESKSSSESGKESKSSDPKKDDKKSSDRDGKTRDSSRSDSRSKSDPRKDRDRSDRRDSDKSRPNDRRDTRQGDRRDRGRSPSDRRDGRDSRSRGKGKETEPIIKSKDGKTDQFGRVIRESDQERSNSRDRSPINRDEIPNSKSDKDNKLGEKKSSKIVINIDKKKEDNLTDSKADGKWKSSFQSDGNEGQSDDKKVLSDQVNIKTESKPSESDASQIQDVDMRAPIKEELLHDGRRQSSDIDDPMDANKLKRKSEEFDTEHAPPPYKIPKLSEKKTEGVNAEEVLKTEVNEDSDIR